MSRAAPGAVASAFTTAWDNLRKANPELAQNMREGRLKRNRILTIRLHTALSSFMTCIYPASFNQMASAETCQRLEQWSLQHTRTLTARQNFLRQIAQPLAFHPTIIEALAPRPPSLSCQSLFARIKSKRITYAKFMTHYRRLCAIRQLSVTAEIEKIGDISLAQATDFCCESSALGPVRQIILYNSGFPTKHHQALSANIAQRRQWVNRFREIKEQVQAEGKVKTSNWHPRDYVNLQLALKDVSADDSAAILQVFLHFTKGRKAKYQMFREDLLVHGREDLLAFLDRRLASLTKREIFTNQSSWHQALIQEARKNLTLELTGRAAHVEPALRALEDRLFHFLLFIEQQLRAPVTLQLFLATATLTDWEKILRSYAKSIKSVDRTSKTFFGQHQAQGPLNSALRFLKGCLRTHLHQVTEAELETLSPKRLLRGIPDLTHKANPSIRRRFTDLECAQMLQQVRDPAESVMITILREVAIRATALGYMKYYDLVTKTHTPRTTCMVIDKNHKARFFRASPHLQARIKNLSDFLRAHFSDPELAEAYVFHLSDLTTPYTRGHIYQFIRSLAKRANITAVHVHPHAFRHTLVCKLVEVGNPIELVSKFIGHSNVSTTRDRYLTWTPDEVTAQLVNPFTAAYHMDEKKKITVREAHKLAGLQVSSCLQIITVMNEKLSGCAAVNGSASQVIAEIAEALPNMKEILELVADSVAESMVDGPEALSSSELSSEEDHHSPELSSDEDAEPVPKRLKA